MRSLFSMVLFTLNSNGSNFDHRAHIFGLKYFDDGTTDGTSDGTTFVGVRMSGKKMLTIEKRSILRDQHKYFIACSNGLANGYLLTLDYGSKKLRMSR